MRMIIYFLLHYVVQNGDTHVLSDLLENFQFLTNVLSANSETPLDMAIRLNNSEMRSILQKKTLPRSTSFPMPSTPPQSTSFPVASPPLQPFSFPMPVPPRPPPIVRRAVNPTPYHPPDNQSSVQPKPHRPPFIGFGHLIRGTNPNDNVANGELINSSPVGPPQHQLQQPYHHHQQQQQQQQQTGTKITHVHPRRTIVREVPLTDRDPSPQPKPISTPSNEQTMRNFKCYITRQIFVDPVIASDGQTYEREAILDWVNTHRCSPTTGAPMDATFRDNNEMKRLIQSMKK
jgi:hypothetical protein